ncbi:lipase maturation factor family protein [Rhodococcus daqingensis]|uniref:Lipase maturation factor family protein n=1 Tax=Rhodococcus daqingensis TaxID=2479363 RepID=A0ABW2S131_9NOCA
MEWFVAEGYSLGRLLFKEGLAVIYLVAFLSAVNQFRPLMGSDGLLPIPQFLRTASFRRYPSLFHLHYSDRFFAVLAWTGVALAALTVVGLTDRLPLPACMLVWFTLWVLYLSIVNVGQTWYGFGWESLLLEAGFLAVFLGNADTASPLAILLLLRWLLFRLEFGAGLIKMRGDSCWRDLTCLYYHHETQPMPGPLSWYFHRLPRVLHRVEAAGNHVTQLVVPFGLFAPQPIAGIAAAIMIVTQLWLVASGNFSWLNWMAIVLAVSVLPDRFFAGVLPVPAESGSAPPAYVGAVIAVTALVLVLSYWPLRNLFSRRQLMNASFNPWHLVNTYGAFGHMTRLRHEVVIEGTAAEEVTASSVWEEYEFKGKPGDVNRRPRQFAPYHLRLDWLMWFAAISPSYARAWFAAFAAKLLENDPATLKLLRHNPFRAAPPAFVRATLYRYRFTTRREHRATGAWWVRAEVGEFLPPVRLAWVSRR